MLSILLVKESPQQLRNTKEAEFLTEENGILKEVLRQRIEKGIEYKHLLEESLGLLDRYQQEVTNLKFRTNMWADEVVRNYEEIGDLEVAMKVTGHEVKAYELKRGRKKDIEKVREELQNLIVKHGTNDSRTIQKSQELDQVILKSMGK